MLANQHKPRLVVCRPRRPAEFLYIHLLDRVVAGVAGADSFYFMHLSPEEQATGSERGASSFAACLWTLQTQRRWQDLVRVYPLRWVIAGVASGAVAGVLFAFATLQQAIER